MAKIILYGILPYISQENYLNISGNTIAEVVLNLIKEFPNLKSYIFENDEFSKFINFYINNVDIRFLPQKTILKDSDTLIIVPAISGG